MVRKKYVSDFLGIAGSSHSKIDFVDINVNDDQKLFIDPILVARNRDELCEEMSRIIDDFFRVFYIAYKRHDYSMKYELLSHAGEVNHTRLGYGNGSNGHGNTATGLIKDFYELEKLIDDISSISKVMDLPVLVKGFNEDGLSDLITNIIHKQLNDYTLEKLSELGISPNATDKFFTWDINTSSWIEVEEPCFECNGEKTLLTPKGIVRKNYLFSADQYMKRIILKREKNEHSIIEEDGKITYTVTVKDLIKRVKKEGKTLNWIYDFVQEESKKDSTYLDDYHKMINSFYIDKGMSDEELDSLIY